MPLINGQKMACEPCIRGHRSTKCNHANDRLMVPVRKPGRPLSSCPHPASRPCSCAAVTAAIPKKQTCRCGPSSSSQPAGPDMIKKEPESNGSSLPTSPTRSTPSAPFRVQKQSSKSAGRKQSVGVAELERMDANQLNIIQGFGPTQQPPVNGTNGMNGHAPMNGMNPYATMPMPAPVFGVPGMYPMMQQPMAQPFSPEINGSANGNGEASRGSTEPASGGCCGGKKATEGASIEKLDTPTESNKPEASGSCCSSKTNGTTTPTQAATENTNGNINGTAMPVFQPPMGMANGMYPFFATPNIFTYPPQYGSYMQPLQPKQWRQAMSNMNMAPQVQQAYMFGGGQPGVPYQQAAGAADPATWTSHQCSCGDSCQCVGCAAHPYNDATQSYVRSAWNAMMQDAAQPPVPNGHAHANGTHTPPGGGQLTGANGIVTSAGGSSKTEGGAGGAMSPTAPQTPSDATSGLAEEQALSANDFFFVSYPFADGCEGEMSSCQCGDDCQCIGCAIHNNPSPGIGN